MQIDAVYGSTFCILCMFRRGDVKLGKKVANNLLVFLKRVLLVVVRLAYQAAKRVKKSWIGPYSDSVM